MTERVVTISNALCVFRLITSLLLPVFAWHEKQTVFLAALSAALFSDAIDGFIARKLNQTSLLGTKLDSWADLTLFFTAPLGAWLLWPDMIYRERIFVGMVVGGIVAPVFLGLLKYRRITSYHTYLAKASGVLMGISCLLLLFHITPWPFRVAAVFLLIEALEEIAITIALPKWTSNVPTLKHALKMRNQQNT